MRRRELILGALALAGCAQQPLLEPPRPRLRLPELKLAPSSFGVSLSLAQRLTVREHTLDVQLEIDASTLRLAAFTLNQRVLTLQWDGRELQQQRHPMLPAEVDAVRVVRDIQLCYWPVDAVRAALPAGWTLDDEPSRRTLRFDGAAQVVIDYTGMPRWQGRAELDNRLEGYRLSIESTAT